MDTPQGYRAEIDGLRAVAVLLVLTYHLDAGVRGGFVGVDVFFVISGYLITRQIVGEYERCGTFSVAGFYRRRALRILPALVVMLALTGLASLVILSPEALAAVGHSMMAATTSVSNVTFWLGTGYFEAENRSQPLLHTWSLGVEEQFYVFWPLAMVSLLRRSRRLACTGVVAMTAASLVSSEWLLRAPLGMLGQLPGAYRISEAPSQAAFFLTPFRMWELGAGALMVWAPSIRVARSLVEELVLGAGLLAIGVAAVGYASDTDFPGLSAALPVLGAMLVIQGGRSAWLGRILRNRPVVGVGKASYSIYLWHWPLLVLTEQNAFDELSLAQRGGLGLVAVIAGLASYRWIEQPWRLGPFSQWPGARLALVSTGTAASLFLFGGWAWAGDGLPWRVPLRRQGMTSQEWRAAERPFCRAWHTGMDRALVPCQNDRGTSQSIFIWGDSHALHLVPGMSETFPQHNVFALYNPGCLPVNGLGVDDRVDTRAATDACRSHNRAALQFLQRQRPSVVVLSASKRGAPAQVAAATGALRSVLRSAGHRVVVLGDFIRPGKSLVQCRAVPDWVIGDARVSRRCQPDLRFRDRESWYSDMFLAGVPGAIDVRSVQCPEGTCRFFQDETPLFRDSHHLSVRGSTIFVAELRDRLGIAEHGEHVSDRSSRE